MQPYACSSQRNLPVPHAVAKSRGGLTLRGLHVIPRSHTQLGDDALQAQACLRSEAASGGSCTLNTLMKRLPLQLSPHQVFRQYSKFCKENLQLSGKAISIYGARKFQRQPAAQEWIAVWPVSHDEMSLPLPSNPHVPEVLMPTSWLKCVATGIRCSQ